MPLESRLDRRKRALLIAAGVAAVVFVVDLLMHRSFVCGMPYVIAVLLVLRSPVRSDVIAAAAVCSVLVAVGHFFSPAGQQQAFRSPDIINDGLVIFVIWGTAGFGLRWKRLEERLVEAEFENLVSNVSASFVNLPLEMLPQAIGSALERVGRFTGAEHAYMCEILDNPQRITMTHEWCAAGILPSRPLIQDIPVEQFPWFWGQIGSLQIVAISDVESLPPEAAPLQELFRSRNVRAFLAVPIVANEKIWGYLGFATLGRRHDWCEQEIAVLKFLGGLLLTAGERLRAESALKASEIRYYELLENAPSVVFVKDREGRYQYVNRRHEQIFHITRPEIFGKLDREIFPDDVARKLCEHDRIVLETGQSLECEEIVPQDDGPHTYIVVKFPLRDSAGDCSAVCGIATDITDRKQAEEKLRNSEYRFRRLFESNIIGAFFCDTRGNIHEANEAFLKLTGYSRDDVPPRWDQMTPPEWRKLDERAIDQLQRTGIAPPWEKEYFRKDGSRVPILLGVAALDFKPGECVVFVLDLSERRAAEERIRQLTAGLEQAARLGVMGEMAAGVAHELHQPLYVIGNYARGAVLRLEQGKLSNEQLIECLNDINAEAQRAGEVIRHIREFIGQQKSEREAVDLSELIGDALRLVKFDALENKIDIVFAPPERLPKVSADPINVTQVLLNLVLNAIQAIAGANFAQDRERRVTVTAAERPHEHLVEVAVADTGPGIPEHARERIFDQFFTTRSSGLGMGLSIARSVILSHGGDLKLAETSPAGTVFVFTLPTIHNASPNDIQHPDLNPAATQDTIPRPT